MSQPPLPQLNDDKFPGRTTRRSGRGQDYTSYRCKHSDWESFQEVLDGPNDDRAGRLHLVQTSNEHHSQNPHNSAFNQTGKQCYSKSSHQSAPDRTGERHPIYERVDVPRKPWNSTQRQEKEPSGFDKRGKILIARSKDLSSKNDGGQEKIESVSQTTLARSPVFDKYHRSYPKCECKHRGGGSYFRRCYHRVSCGKDPRNTQRPKRAPKPLGGFHTSFWTLEPEYDLIRCPENDREVEAVPVYSTDRVDKNSQPQNHYMSSEEAFNSRQLRWQSQHRIPHEAYRLKLSNSYGILRVPGARDFEAEIHFQERRSRMIKGLIQGKTFPGGRRVLDKFFSIPLERNLWELYDLFKLSETSTWKVHDLDKDETAETSNPGVDNLQDSYTVIASNHVNTSQTSQPPPANQHPPVINPAVALRGDRKSVGCLASFLQAMKNVIKDFLDAFRHEKQQTTSERPATPPPPPESLLAKVRSSRRLDDTLRPKYYEIWTNACDKWRKVAPNGPSDEDARKYELERRRSQEATENMEEETPQNEKERTSGETAVGSTQVSPGESPVAGAEHQPQSQSIEATVGTEPGQFSEMPAVATTATESPAGRDLTQLLPAAAGSQSPMEMTTLPTQLIRSAGALPGETKVAAGSESHESGDSSSAEATSQSQREMTQWTGETQISQPVGVSSTGISPPTAVSHTQNQSARSGTPVQQHAPTRSWADVAASSPPSPPRSAEEDVQRELVESGMAM